MKRKVLTGTSSALALALAAASGAQAASRMLTPPAVLAAEGFVTLARGSADDGRSRHSSDDDGTPDQGPGDAGGTSGGSGDDDGTPDQGSGDNGTGGPGNSGSGHGGHGGDDSGGHGAGHSLLTPLGTGIAPAFAAFFIDEDPGFDTARGGRSKPRIPGGSGCDDPGDLIEHPECAG